MINKIISLAFLFKFLIWLIKAIFKFLAYIIEFKLKNEDKQLQS